MPCSCPSLQLHRIKHQYAFPTQTRPTPHQIFHLPRSASQADIKKRYIDLVKLHHPDSALCKDVPATERHRRFQCISSAYDTLRHLSSTGMPDRDHVMWEEIEKRKRAHYRHSRRAEYAYTEWNPQSSADDKWKDRAILTFGFIALIAGLLPTLVYPRRRYDRSPSSAANLSEARRDARLLYEARQELDRQAAEEYPAPKSRGK
ncbi:hypothetical protein B0H10DRAFT_1789925 [Mycena sp. CBHHK59/15]|nr:hypothetical protein B0H10DRAFT_1789925 [Mycena sp. CBHHK59/15]